MTDAHSTSLYAGRYLNLQSRDGWEYIDRQHRVVAMIAWTPADELLLVEQYRIPVARRTIEIPAGLVGDQAESADEPLVVAARRELREETGWDAGRMTEIMQCPTSAGMSSETVVFFLASELSRVGPGGGDESEDIVVHSIARHDIDVWLAARYREGYAIDPKIYAALYWSIDREENPVADDNANAQ